MFKQVRSGFNKSVDLGYRDWPEFNFQKLLSAMPPWSSGDTGPIQCVFADTTMAAGANPWSISIRPWWFRRKFVSASPCMSDVTMETFVNKTYPCQSLTWNTEYVSHVESDNIMSPFCTFKTVSEVFIFNSLSETTNIYGQNPTAIVTQYLVYFPCIVLL